MKTQHQLSYRARAFATPIALLAFLLLLPAAAGAQHRGGHSGGGHSRGGHSSGGGHSGGHAGGGHYSGGHHRGGHLSFLYPHSYGYPHYYRHGSPYYPYGAPYSRGYGGSYGSPYSDGRAMGALDLDVRPGRTVVYDEGQYLGTVDDFDGFPGYLWLSPGTHVITFYLEGYRTVEREYSVAPGRVAQVVDVLERGESVSPEDLTVDGRRPAGPPSGGTSGSGNLRLEVVPRDAAVYLDGRFVGTGEELASMDLSVEPGEHVLEVVRPGYQTQTRRVTVEPGGRAGQQLELDRR